MDIEAEWSRRERGFTLYYFFMVYIGVNTLFLLSSSPNGNFYFSSPRVTEGSVDYIAILLLFKDLLLALLV